MTIKINGTNTTAQPSITGTDTDTGLVYGTDEVKVVTNATDRVTVNNTGMGIGTSAPAQKLHVSGKIQFGENSTYHGLIEHDEGTTGANIYTSQDTGGHIFKEQSTVRMVIDGSGRLLVGTTTEGLAGSADKLTLANSGDTGITIRSGSSNYGNIMFSDATSGTGEYAGYVQYYHNDNCLKFGTASTERFRIDSSGRLLAGLTSSSKNARIVAEGNSDNAASSAEVYLQRGTATPPDGADLASIHFADNTGTTGAVIRGRREGGTWSGSSKPSSLLFSTCADGGTALATRMMISNDGRVATYMSSTSGLVLGTAGNATNYTIIKGKSSSTGINTGNDVFYVYGNGNVQNSNNSYGQISDQKLKENIVDANSQWDNIKDVRVRNFNFIEGQTHTQIGVVAQELEAVSPGLIDEAPDRDEDGNDLGTVTKSVKYSVLYMKAVKALQEAMERIETLETQNASLEARLTALEGGAS